MGTLYWQLNDVWPSVSWSSLDHAVGWKTLHYHARRFYAPVALATRIDGGRLLISGLNDRHEPAAVEARVRRVDLDGKILDETMVVGTLPPDRSVEIGAMTIPPGTDFFYTIEARKRGDAAFDDTLRLTVFPEKFKRYDFPAATITLASTGKPGAFMLSADKPAFFIKPEASEFAGAFDDASFALLPGEKRTIAFRSFHGRMPAASDIAISHVGATYR
jgi:beta-mannosidase